MACLSSAKGTGWGTCFPTISQTGEKHPMGVFQCLKDETCKMKLFPVRTSMHTTKHADSLIDFIIPTGSLLLPAECAVAV